MTTRLKSVVLPPWIASRVAGRRLGPQRFFGLPDQWTEPGPPQCLRPQESARWIPEPRKPSPLGLLPWYRAQLLTRFRHKCLSQRPGSCPSCSSRQCRRPCGMFPTHSPVNPSRLVNGPVRQLTPSPRRRFYNRPSLPNPVWAPVPGRLTLPRVFQPLSGQRSNG